MKPDTVSRAIHKSILRVLMATAVVLAIPLVAMQFTDEVDWDVTDFIIVGFLLIVAGLAYEFAVRKIKNTTQRIIGTIVLLMIVLLIWVELAVGVFGTVFGGQ